MSIIPLDKLEQLRREQGQENTVEERPALYAPEPPMEFVSGSADDDDAPERGVTIIDFTV
tara:strand:+ start:11370 stop:11549 length:180 start_codon:yes stop_codon:yes gene_type:complete